MSTSVNVDGSDVASPNSLCWELIFCNAVNQLLLDKERKHSGTQINVTLCKIFTIFKFSYSAFTTLRCNCLGVMVNQDHIPAK